MVNFESMGALSFSFLDVVVVAVVLASAGFAAWRGFVQESLSILAWAAAAFAALYFGPSAVVLLRGVLSGWGAIVAAYAGIFLVIVIPLSFISYRFAEGIRRTPIHALDRTLGFVFGIVRGLVIVAICYLVFSMIVPIPRQPRWMTQARLLPLIQSSAQVLLALVPEQKITQAQRASKPHREASRAASGDADTAHAPKTPQKSYGAKDRRALDRLIETTANGGGQKP